MANFDFLNWGKTASSLPEVPGVGSFSLNQLSQGQAANSLSNSGASLTSSLDAPAFSMGAYSSPSLDFSGASTQPTLMQRLAGYTDGKTGTVNNGLATPALGLLQSGLSFWQGKEQLDLAKDQLSTSKQQFSDQFNVQKQLTNMSIKDQGQRRYDRNPTMNATPEDYYNENKLS